MNQKIRQLELILMDTLNGSDLPAEVKRILLGKLEAQMTILSNKEILDTELRKENQNAKGV